MKGWYRVFVVMMGMAVIACTSAVAYAGYKLLGNEQLLSNEVLIREVSEWWSENVK